MRGGEGGRESRLSKGEGVKAVLCTCTCRSAGGSHDSALISNLEELTKIKLSRFRLEK